MSHNVHGVVVRSRGARVSIETVVVPDPGPDEVLIRVQACGVCHTDLHYRNGGIGDDFPYLLGHEAAGTVEAAGEGVTNVERGDMVIVAWRAPCGICRSCRRGRPWYCFDSHNAAQRMTLEDGTPLTAAIGVGGFCELTLVHALQAVKIAADTRPEAACLIGCGVMAGYGAAVNTGMVTQGDTVAVIGCGGVGSAAVAGAAIAGARTVIAVDVAPHKLEWATRFGATHTVNAGETDPVEAIRDLTDGFGADVVIDAVGLPQTYRQAFLARDLAGRLVQVGVPPDSAMTIDLPLGELFGHGGSLRSSWYGDSLPTRDFPILVDLYKRGRLDLDGFVSETIGINDVEAAFAKIERSEVLRSVVVF
jgi:S-(hydroxymethyl)mycothiol dehydrogenase